MEIKNYIKNALNEIKNKVIAIVYTFENENAPGFQHYDFWRSEVLSDWLRAIEELNCKPYILDVRTFIFKVSTSTLPHIDFCINLNAGNMNIDNLCIIPSLCSFLNIPCLPCSAKACAIGEDKYFANLIASTGRINIPKKLQPNMEGGIIRNRNYGSSIGIRKTNHSTKCSPEEICQEFIEGYDATIPILYNPITNKLEVLPPVVYKHPYSQQWFLDEQAKKQHSYEKTIGFLSNDATEEILNLANKFDILTYCRIDTRITGYSFEQKKSISINDIYFIEMNPTPTIHNNINFAFSILNISSDYQHSLCLKIYKELISKSSITGYILFCSILAFKAKHY